MSFLEFLGKVGVASAVAGFAYWLVQKLLDEKFARRLEDYRHAHAISAQNEKIRLDLYNRRFEIFSSIFDFYEAVLSWKGNPEQVAARTRFFRAYQESGFLFRKESGIEDLLKKLNDDANKVIGFKEHGDQLKADPALYLKQLDETGYILTSVFSEALTKLKLAMSEYLNFHNIDQ